MPPRTPKTIQNSPLNSRSPVLTSSSALFLDIDGTLLDLAPRPSEVEVPRHLAQTLQRISQRLDGALALISGRSLRNIDQFFYPIHFTAAGLHGCEVRFPNGHIKVCTPLPDHVRLMVTEKFYDRPEIEIEDKSGTIAVHYRHAPEQELAIHDYLLPLAQQNHLGLLAGKMVWEIRDPRFTKASAIHLLLQHDPFVERQPIFVGDDITDSEGFDIVETLGGMALPVGSGHCTARSAVFPNPSAVRRWLTELASKGLDYDKP